jgi:outer membrane protein assembly factor BamB
MRTHAIRRFAVAALAAVPMTALLAQSREWTTSGFDAQRTSWLRTDERLTRDAIEKGEFQFLWKMKFENTNRQLNSLTPPVLLDRLIGFRGFKSLGFFGASDDRIFAIDTDLGRPAWTTVLNYSAATGGSPPTSWDCPGGLTAMPSRRTALAPPTFTGGGGGGRFSARNGSAVGEPGKGAAVLADMAKRPPPSPPAPGRGPAANPTLRGPEPLLAVGSDGFLHALYVSNGLDREPPVPFVPPDARHSDLIVVDDIVYTTTSGGCGWAPNAVWAMNLAAPLEERKAVSWNTGGNEIAGAVAFGTDGTLYVALGKPAKKQLPGSHADAIVALDRRTLQVKDWFTAPGADFNAMPMIVRHRDRDLIVATANDGRLYVLDGSSLGGSGHQTPLAVSGRFTGPGAGSGLATFEHQATRWILTTASGTGGDVKFTANGPTPSGRVVAFSLQDEGGKLSLTPGWQSRDLVSPLAPVVINGMVFAVSSGEYRGPASVSLAERVKRSVPAVLYVLDAPNGKTMWNSGKTITSFARAAVSAGGGQAYLVTYDNHVYAFGIPLEH